MNEYYIIVDRNNNPVSWYTDEYQYYYDVSHVDINESEVFSISETGYEEVLDMKEQLNEAEVRSDEGIEFPLKVVKIKAYREIVE